jgi:hypothetical protein
MFLTTTAQVFQVHLPPILVARVAVYGLHPLDPNLIRLMPLPIKGETFLLTIPGLNGVIMPKIDAAASERHRGQTH